MPSWLPPARTLPRWARGRSSGWFPDPGPGQPLLEGRSDPGRRRQPLQHTGLYLSPGDGSRNEWAGSAVQQAGGLRPSSGGSRLPARPSPLVWPVSAGPANGPGSRMRRWNGRSQPARADLSSGTSQAAARDAGREVLMHRCLSSTLIRLCKPSPSGEMVHPAGPGLSRCPKSNNEWPLRAVVEAYLQRSHQEHGHRFLKRYICWRHVSDAADRE